MHLHTQHENFRRILDASLILEAGKCSVYFLPFRFSKDDVHDAARGLLILVG